MGSNPNLPEAFLHLVSPTNALLPNKAKSKSPPDLLEARSIQLHENQAQTEIAAGSEFEETESKENSRRRDQIAGEVRWSGKSSSKRVPNWPKWRRSGFNGTNWCSSARSEAMGGHASVHVKSTSPPGISSWE